jgi:hypothetical protein
MANAQDASDFQQLVAEIVALEVSSQIAALSASPRFTAEERDALLNAIAPHINERIATITTTVDHSLSVAEERIAGIAQQIAIQSDDIQKAQNQLGVALKDLQLKVDALDGDLRFLRELSKMTRRRDAIG